MNIFNCLKNPLPCLTGKMFREKYYNSFCKTYYFLVKIKSSEIKLFQIYREIHALYD